MNKVTYSGNNARTMAQNISQDYTFFNIEAISNFSNNFDDSIYLLILKIKGKILNKINNDISKTCIVSTNYEQIFDDTTMQNNIFNIAKENALECYKIINKKEYDFNRGESFLNAILPFCKNNSPVINFYDDSISVTIKYKNVKYILDYDFDCPETTFVTTFKYINGKEKMFIKEATIKNIYEVVDSF